MRWRVSSFAGAVATLLSSAPARAQSAGPPITMQWAVDAALASHPAMRAASARRRSAEAGPEQAFALPDPMLMVEGFPAYRFGEGPEMFMFSVRQDIPLGSERGRSARAAEREVLAARADAGTVALDLVLGARLSFIRLAEAEETRARREEELDLARATAEVVRARVGAGAGAPSDALAAAFLVTETEAALETARGEERAAWAALAAFVGAPADRALPPARPLVLPPEPPPLRTLLDRARAARPELQALAARRGAARERAAAARARGAPMLSFEAGYMLDLMDADGLMGTVGVSVPIFPGARTAVSRQATADAAALEADADSLARTIEGQIGESRAALVTARARTAIVRERLVPQAHAHHELALAEFARGQTDLFAVLDALRHHIASRLEEVMTIAQAARLQALLDRATGAPFTASNRGN